MAFTKIEKSPLGRSGARNLHPVCISKSEKNGATQVSILSVVAKAAGLQEGDFIAVEIGSGEDDGWVRLSKSEKGFKLGRNGGASYRVKFCCGNLLKHVKSLSSTGCKSVVSGSAILFEIPARLRTPTISVAA